MYDYGRFRNTADRLLGKYANQEYRLTRGQDKISIVNGVEVKTAAEVFTVVGIKTDLDPKLADGENILSTDISGVFKAEPAIQQGDVITIDGQRYTVIRPRPVKPSDVVILYKPIMRAIPT